MRVSVEVPREHSLAVVTWAEAIGNQAKAAVCSVLGDVEAATRWVARTLSDPGDTPKGSSIVRTIRGRICNDPAGDYTPPPSPFTGGQCTGVLYNVTITVDSCLQRNSDPPTSCGPSTGTVSIVGPITNVGYEVNGPSPPSASIIVFAENAQGDREELGIRFTALSGASYVDDELISIDIVRNDGLPDACGNPVAPIPPYTPVTVIRDITYEDNSQTTITEEGDFTVLAPIIIGGNIIAPVRVDVGGIEIPLNINLDTGDISIDFGGSDTPPGIGDDDPVENPTGDEPEIEEGSLFYGLIVYATESGNAQTAQTVVAQAAAPTLRIPRMGNVYFQLPIGDRVTWQGPHPVQLQNQLIMVPDGLGASGFRLVPETGWELEAVRVGKPPLGRRVSCS